MWEADLTVIERELTLVGVNPALDHLKDLAARLRSDVLTAARDSARHSPPGNPHDGPAIVIGTAGTVSYRLWPGVFPRLTSPVPAGPGS
jgi:hypothetical protein